jgi:hypothetical protein
VEDEQPRDRGARQGPATGERGQRNGAGQREADHADDREQVARLHEGGLAVLELVIVGPVQAGQQCDACGGQER